MTREQLIQHARELRAKNDLPNGVGNTIDALCAALSRTAEPREDVVERVALDDLVVRFSAALTAKLVASEEKYGWRNAWAKDDWRDALSQELTRHVAKGDPIDVAAYCAFAWHHGWSLSALPAQGEPSEEIADLKSSVIAFAAPWAVQWAEMHELPKGHLHPEHYDLLARCGARMDDFTRAAAPLQAIEESELPDPPLSEG